MNKTQRPLRVFEAFAGIGAQATALKRIGVNFEVVGISDWFTDAIICYDAIHSDKTNTPSLPDKKEILSYLSQFQFSKDSVHPSRIESFDDDYLEKLYIANKRAKNYGSITQIKGSDMPDTDLLVYSFPCQDLSTGGKGLGMKKGSGTRSGLLWEIERILRELNEEGRLPEYLLLENVKTILAKSNRADLDQWLAFLESLGYSNDECMILNALDFGVPQERERAFIVSHLGDKLNVGSQIVKQERKYDFYRFFAKKNIARKAAGKPEQKELTATDYLKEREHPILVIYPIELKTEVSDNEVKARFGSITEESRSIIKAEKEALYKEVCGSIPLMAFAVAFPAKESPKKFTYRANLQKLKELTDDLEVTDDEEGEDDNG